MSLDPPLIKLRIPLNFYLGFNAVLTVSFVPCQNVILSLGFNSNNLTFPFLLFSTERSSRSTPPPTNQFYSMNYSSHPALKLVIEHPDENVGAARYVGVGPALEGYNQCD